MDSKVLRIVNLDDNTTDESLKHFIEQYVILNGIIETLFVRKDELLQLVYAYVVFKHDIDAKKTLQRLKGFYYNSLYLEVELIGPSLQSKQYHLNSHNASSKPLFSIQRDYNSRARVGPRLQPKKCDRDSDVNRFSLESNQTKTAVNTNIQKNVNTGITTGPPNYSLLKDKIRTIPYLTKTPISSTSLQTKTSNGNYPNTPKNFNNEKTSRQHSTIGHSNSSSNLSRGNSLNLASGKSSNFSSGNANLSDVSSNLSRGNSSNLASGKSSHFSSGNGNFPSISSNLSRGNSSSLVSGKSSHFANRNSSNFSSGKSERSSNLPSSNLSGAIPSFPKTLIARPREINKTEELDRNRTFSRPAYPAMTQKTFETTGLHSATSNLRPTTSNLSSANPGFAQTLNARPGGINKTEAQYQRNQGTLSNFSQVKPASEASNYFQNSFTPTHYTRDPSRYMAHQTAKKDSKCVIS